MDAKATIQATIDYLTEEFIVEECVGNLTEGCMSCEMIETRASLRKVLEMLHEAEASPPTQEQEG